MNSSYASPPTWKAPLTGRAYSPAELRHGDEVAFAVPEPGGLDRAVVHDPVAEGRAGRRLVGLEFHAAFAQRGYRPFHVVHDEAELVVSARRRTAGGKDEERPAAALVEEVVPVLPDRLEPEHVAVEGTGAFDVLRRQLPVGAAEDLSHPLPLVRSSSDGAILRRSSGSFTFASSEKSSTTRAVSRPSRTARSRRSPVSKAGSMRRATAHGSGPAWATAASRQASASTRSASAVKSGMSTGTTTARSWVAARRPTAIAATGPVPGSASPSPPTTTRSSHASPSMRHARSSSVSPPKRASAFGDPKRLLAPPTSRIPVSPRSATAPCRR